MNDRELIIGTWADDYEINYKIDDHLWKMGSEITFHVIEWNRNKNFIIVENDSNNAYNAGQYSRIDYIILDNMKPYEWAFCLTAYDKDTAIDARNTPAADGENPKSGCNGFPFSRMKRY
ncbi:MAG: hypothetical protein HKN68_09015 [Saprospiraceae bacterium]|nr:hypothetical protein [Saprospiraceae bacterium]